MSSFFRYPGGKTKIYNIIEKELSKYDIPETYAEPFFGGGSVGLKLLSSNSNIKSIYINDKNSALECLWTSVIKYPKELKKMILSYVPSVESFFKIKQQLLNYTKQQNENSDTVIKYGFMQLAIHQISYSGLGVKSGGPLGGKKQQSKYKIDCRWSPQYMCNKIDKVHNLFKQRQVEMHNDDFDCFIKKVDGIKALIYLDPPYYIKGNELYQYGFSTEDHIRLSNCLKNIKSRWVLSYDNCPEIHDLYSWAKITDINVKYTINTSRKKSELLITNDI